MKPTPAETARRYRRLASDLTLISYALRRLGHVRQADKVALEAREAGMLALAYRGNHHA